MKGGYQPLYVDHGAGFDFPVRSHRTPVPLPSHDCGVVAEQDAGGGEFTVHFGSVLLLAPLCPLPTPVGNAQSVEPSPGGPPTVDQNVGSGDESGVFGTEITG
jgi:hypothetical protein